MDGGTDPAHPDDPVAALTRAVGAAVRAAREQAGLSRRALSDLSGVSQRYLAQVEGGQGNISIVLLARLGQALDRPVHAFLGAPETGDARLGALWAQADTAQRKAVLDILDPRPDRRRKVALIGLRGAGKSTLGRRAAAALDQPFAELNDVIEVDSGLPVADVIALYGQDGYRALERRALDAVLTRHDTMVLAVAGGIVADTGTYQMLIERCFTIWLKASPEDHMERVRAQGDVRPMAGNPDAMADLRAILQTREADYARADATLDTSGRTEDAVLDDLLALIRDRALLA